MQGEEGSFSDVPTELWDQIREAVERFEGAWESGLQPPLESFVVGDGVVRRSVIAAMVRVDLERRASCGDVPRIEGYLEQFPELRGNAQQVLELLVAEYTLRLRREEVSADEYISRFPDLSGELAERLAEVTGQISTQNWKAGDTADLVRPPQAGSKSLAASLPELPGYEVLGIVASGGMGSVYRARDISLNRQVAIKLPRRELVDEEGRERFLREARSAAKLRHPNICPIHQIGDVDGRPYIAMGFIDGPTLRGRAQQKPLTAREAAEIVAKVARAVEAAHQHGVVHRDIKPANILIDRETNEPILTDFGLAKELSETDVQMTQTGQVMGTPAYMAPEQASGDSKAIGPATDVYALGAVLYELLCGRPPFTGGIAEILSQLSGVEPPAPRKLSPRLHRDLETICQKAMAKSPPERYGSALELAEDLERFVQGEAIQARPHPWLVRAFRRARRNLAFTAAAVLAIAIVIVATIVGVSARNDRRVATLSTQIDSAFEDPLWSVRWLEAVDDRVRELRELEPSAAEAADRQIVSFLHAAAERELTLRLDEARIQRLRELLEMLAPRDASAAERLSGQLERRLATWEPLFDLKTPFEELPEVFDPQGWLIKDNEMLRVVANEEMPKGNAPAAPQSVPAFFDSPTHVKLEAEFGASWSEQGLLELRLDDRRGHRGHVHELHFSPDSRWLLSASRASEAILWDLRTGGSVFHKTFLGNSTLTLVRFTHDAAALVMRDGNGLCVVEVPTGRELRRLPGGVDFDVSQAGDLVATANAKEIVVSRWSDGAVVQRFPLNDVPTRVRFSADGSTLAATCNTGLLAVWETSDWSQRELRQAHSGPIMCLAVSGDGALIATGSKAEGVRLESPGAATGASKFDFPISGSNSILQFSLDGGRLMGAFGSSIRSWTLRSGIERRASIWDCYPTMSRDGRWITGSRGGLAIIWDAATMKEAAVVGPHDDTVAAFAFSPDDRVLAVGDRAGTICLWDMSTRRRLSRLRNSAYIARLQRPIARAPAAQGGDEASRASEMKNPGEYQLQLLHDGQLLVDQTADLSSLLGRSLRLSVQRESNVFTLRAGLLSPVVFEDIVGVRLRVPGKLAVTVPEATGLLRLTAYTMRKGADPSPLEAADFARTEGDWETASRLYRSRTGLDEDAATRMEAKYKLALCLIAIGDGLTARQLFQEMIDEASAARLSPEADRWAMLAAFQQWKAILESRDFDGADGLRQFIEARYRLEDLVLLIPIEERRRIIAAYQVWNLYSYNKLLYEPKRTTRLSEAVRLSKLFGFGPGEFQMNLVIAFFLEGDLDEALAATEEAKISPEYVGGFAYYLWILRQVGRGDEALAAVDQCLDHRPDNSGSEAFWRIERARLLADRGEIPAAIEELNAAIGMQPEKKHAVDEVIQDAYLMLGLLLEESDPIAARKAWKDGLAFSRARYGPHPTHRIHLRNLLSYLMLGSLSEELTDDEMQTMFDDVIADLTGISQVSGMARALLGPVQKKKRMAAAIAADMWRTDGGKEIARAIAFRTIGLDRTISWPLALAISQWFERSILDRPATPEESDLIWSFADHGLDVGIRQRKLDPTNTILSAAVAWDNPGLFTGWDSLAKSLAPAPELLGPAAFVFGHRYRQLEDRDEACRLFQTALDIAPPNSPLARLAKEQLDALAAVKDSQP